jgi:SAM-dependent methyltransferase
MTPPTATDTGKNSLGCFLCGSRDIEFIGLPFPFFQHMNYHPLPDSRAAVYRCRCCQMVFPDQSGEEQKIRDLYRSKEYAATRPSIHYSVVKESESPVTPYFLVANIIYKLLKKKSPRILDIGCFDGKLLQELDRRYDAAELHGFDVSEHIGALFPNKENFRFWQGSVADIEGEFDLVVSMNSLPYVEDIRNVMNKLFSMLNEKGVLFVLVPDISKNNQSILLGDEFAHFTPNTLKNFFLHYGYDLEILDSAEVFPRHVIGVARAGATADKPNGYFEDREVHGAREYLIELKRKLEHIKARSETSASPGQLAVLGTKLNAAVTHSVLGDGIDFFVDENPSAEGQYFLGKPVHHPRELEHEDTVIIPLGRTSEPIKQRFEQTYGGTVICV